jgi:hypothetical protein
MMVPLQFALTQKKGNDLLMAELLFNEESFKIIGICMEIHKTRGMGLKEINYKDAKEIENFGEKISRMETHSFSKLV